MQKFRGILRVGFVIAFRMGHFLNDKILITWAAERVPPRAAKTAGKHPDHLGKRKSQWKGFAIRERVYSLFWHTSSKGMPRHAHRRLALARVFDVEEDCALLRPLTSNILCLDDTSEYFSAQSIEFHFLVFNS